MENVNYFDLTVLTLVALLGLKGLFKGFTKELFGLIGIVGGVFIASRLAKDTGDLVNGIIPIDNEKTLLLAGFVVSLIIFWIIAYILGNLVAKALDLSGLGIFDRIFGFLFGAGKIFLIFSIIAYAVTNVKTINDQIKPKLKESILFPMLVSTGGYIIKLDTSSLTKEVGEKINEAVDSTKETIKKIASEEIKQKVLEQKELKQKELEKKAEELEKQLKETSSEK